MNITQVAIPQYDGTKGNWKPGRQGTAIDTVVLHWIDGDQASCDLSFRNPARIACAHFSVENDQVHQYVGTSDTAFHAGNWEWNLRSIGIEMSAQPGRDATDETYETVAQVIAKIGRPANYRRHQEVSDRFTECCGTVDVGRIAARVNALLAAPQAVPANAVTLPVKEAAHSLVNALNVRSTPSTQSADNVTGTFSQGQGFWYVGKTEGNGHLWLILENNVGYVASEFTDYNPNQNA